MGSSRVRSLLRDVLPLSIWGGGGGLGLVTHCCSPMGCQKLGFMAFTSSHVLLQSFTDVSCFSSLWLRLETKVEDGLS